MTDVVHFAGTDNLGPSGNLVPLCGQHGHDPEFTTDPAEVSCQKCLGQLPGGVPVGHWAPRDLTPPAGDPRAGARTRFRRPGPGPSGPMADDYYQGIQGRASDDGAARALDLEPPSHPEPIIPSDVALADLPSPWTSSPGPTGVVGVVYGSDELEERTPVVGLAGIRRVLDSLSSGDRVLAMGTGPLDHAEHQTTVAGIRLALGSLPASQRQLVLHPYLHRPGPTGVVGFPATTGPPAMTGPTGIAYPSTGRAEVDWIARYLDRIEDLDGEARAHLERAARKVVGEPAAHHPPAPVVVGVGGQWHPVASITEVGSPVDMSRTRRILDRDPVNDRSHYYGEPGGTWIMRIRLVDGREADVGYFVSREAAEEFRASLYQPIGWDVDDWRGGS